MSKMKERWREQQDRDNQPEPAALAAAEQIAEAA